MDSFRANTDVMRNAVETISKSASTLSDVANRISSLNSQISGAYQGQLRDKVEPILSGALGDGMRLNSRSLEFSGNLNILAGEIDKVMQLNNGMTVNATTASTVTGSPLTNFFRGVGQSALGAVAALLVWAGFEQKTPPITAFPTPSPVPTPTPLISSPLKVIQASTASSTLGSLSQKYESNGDPGRVSTGAGDAGDVSYGAYQMTSVGGGTVARFLKSSAGNPWSNEFSGLTPGTKEFSAKWQEIANRDPKKFSEAQHEYIKQTHYDPLVEKISKIGLDVESRSETLKNVVWSTGVQHGGSNNIIDVALEGRNPANMGDEEIIRAIYAERGRKNPDGTLVHFQSNSVAMQIGVAKRFGRELNDALEMLRLEF